MEKSGFNRLNWRFACSLASNVAAIRYVFMKTLPIRRIEFGNHAEKSAHDEIVRLGERKLVMQKERQPVRREDDLDSVRNLEKQIVQVNSEIDQRVYRLYGLTEDEVKVVEGKKK